MLCHSHDTSQENLACQSLFHWFLLPDSTVKSQIEALLAAFKLAISKHFHGLARVNRAKFGATLSSFQLYVAQFLFHFQQIDRLASTFTNPCKSLFFVTSSLPSDRLPVLFVIYHYQLQGKLTFRLF